MSSTQRIELPQGTLDLLILQTLVLEPQHGWAIAKRIQQVSKGIKGETVSFSMAEAPASVKIVLKNWRRVV